LEGGWMIVSFSLTLPDTMQFPQDG